MRITSTLVATPVVVAGLFYASRLLGSPIPVDGNTPALFVSALQGTPNLLSAVVWVLRDFTPSITVYSLTVFSIILLCGAAILLHRALGTGGYGVLVSLCLLLILPFVVYAFLSGLLVVTVPAALATMGLALATKPTRRRVLAALAFILPSAAIVPLISITAGVIALCWIVLTWRRSREESLNYAMFANTAVLAGIAGFSVTQQVGLPVILPLLLRLQQNPALYLPLIVAALAGLYLAYLNDKLWLFKISSWLLLVLLFWRVSPETLVLIAVPLAVVCSLPLSHGLKGMAVVNRVGGEPMLEIDGAKLVGVLFILAILVSSLSQAFALLPSISSTYSNLDPRTMGATASFLGGAGSSIVAPLQVLPWVSLYSGQSPPRANSTTLESWGQTSFRVQNSYIRADDWEPFSVSRAPRIAVFNGSTFQYVLYVDDSYVRFNMTNGESVWTVSPKGMTFLGYQWGNGSSLVMSFASRWLLLQKAITIENSTVSLDYKFRALNGAEVTNGSLGIWADWPYTYNNETGSGSIFFVRVGGSSFQVEGAKGSVLSFGEEGQPTQPRLRVSQDFSNATGDLKVVIHSFDAVSSEGGSFRASIFDYFRSGGNKYVIAQSGSPSRFVNVSSSFLQSLYLVDAYQTAKFHTRSPINFLLQDSSVRVKFYTYTANTAPLFSIIDSFMRANFTLGGPTYTDAPSNGVVVSEQVSGNNRTVGYETAGLTIAKTLTLSGGDMKLEYRFTAKEGTVTGVNGMLWLPWGLNYSYSLQGNALKLKTPMGAFNITANSPLRQEVAPSGPAGQPGIRISGPSDHMSVEVKSLQPLSPEYIPAQRPRMNGSDEIAVSAPYLMGPWVDSPASAIIQSESAGSVVASTNSIKFSKSVNYDAKSATVSYTFSPLGRTEIVGGTVVVWLDLNLHQLKHNLTSSYLNIPGYEVGWPSSARGALGNSSFGTPVLNLTYGGNAMSVSITGNLSASYQPGGRPHSDDLLNVAGFVVNRYAESPSLAKVSESSSTPSNRTIEYQTNGLVFAKSVVQRDNRTVAIDYRTVSKDGGILDAVRATVFIPSDRSVLNYSIGGSSIRLNLDSGVFNVTASPAPLNVSYVANPQPSLVLTFKPQAGNFSSFAIRISSSSALALSYQDSSRPLENSSDVVYIEAHHGVLQPFLQMKDLEVFRVVSSP